MAQYSLDDIHTLALVGHAGAGKTLLAEALLHNGGAINTKGSIARGSTVCDYDPLEKKHHHSLDTSVCSLDYKGKHITLLDTPGYPDLIGRALAVLPAVETVAIVVNASSGIEAVTQRMMNAARRRGLCRIIIINHIDSDETNLHALLREIRDTFGKECLPMNLPAKGREGVVDCFFAPDGAETDFASVADAHEAIVDQVVEVDEELMATYLDKGEVSAEQLHDPFEKALREGHLVPVCFVSAETGAGVPELLEVLAKLMPNPKEGNPPHFFKGENGLDENVIVAPEADKHLIAHAFKVSIDPFMGQMGVFRVHQGTVTPGSQLYVGEARKPIKISHLYRLQGNERIEVERGLPGDICAVAKMDDIHYNSVLHDSPEDTLHLEPMAIPEPMVGLAIAPAKRGDEQKLSEALHKLEAEDPSVRIDHNAATNETVIRGMGDLHLRLVLERMKERYKLDVQTRPPAIAYRETITCKAEGHHRHKKQTGGAGQFGEVFLRIEPLPRGTGFEFASAVVGASIPTSLIPAVDKGVRQALATGAIAGHKLQDIKVTVYDGKHHPVDSKEIAFATAGRKAFIDAVLKARPIILEPIVHLDVTVPGDRMGDVTGDLSSRRGRIVGNVARSNHRVVVQAEVPLAELEEYQSRLKSLTGGEGTYTLEFSGYEPVPPDVQKTLREAYKPVEED